MLIAVRHGKTKMNSDGKERSRGWLSVPLTLEGMQESAETADSLMPLDDVKTIYTSDLFRAVQSAQEIGMALDMELTPTENLRDWNVGDYTGQEVAKNLTATHALIDNPTKPAPNGEPYQTFLDRTVPFLVALVESKDLVIAVTHNRVMTLLNALLSSKGDHPDIATLKQKGPVEPSGIMIIDPKWKVVYQSKAAKS